LKATDAQGMTVIHHLVFSNDFGSFENTRLLEVLLDAGADVNAKDAIGKMALDYATARGAARLAAHLQKAMKQNDEVTEAPFDFLKRFWFGSLSIISGE
jgi:ankyrin repeat protein